MKNRLSEFAVGLIVGTGLIVSGMTDPGKVIGFLDLAGLWDPSLALVMGGAIGIAIVAFTWARRRTTTLLGGALKLPTVSAIDRRLVLGSLSFGAGWGLAGFCPGPALASLGLAACWRLTSSLMPRTFWTWWPSSWAATWATAAAWAPLPMPKPTASGRSV